MALICACHRYGWPVARGGSRAITDALAAVVREHGGAIETGRRVRSLERAGRRRRGRARPRARRRSPTIAGDRLPAGWRAPTAATATGPGRSRSTWRSRAACRGRRSRRARAGTVHAIGSFEETVAAEREVNRGRMPERPFVLVGQQYLADPTRSRGDVHPGLGLRPRAERLRRRRDRGGDRPDRAVRARPARADRRPARVRSPAELEAHNANYVGGDIITGANTPRADPHPPAARARPVRDRDPGRLHLLGRDAARRRRARDERLQRRRSRRCARSLRSPTETGRARRPRHPRSSGPRIRAGRSSARSRPNGGRARSA